MTKLKLAEKNTLIKHSAVVHISNNLTATERKISNILLKNAFSNLNKTIKHSISIRDILLELGHAEDRNNPPPVVYKYKPINPFEHIEEIFLGKIYAASLKDFNDPMDCQIPYLFTPSINEEWFKRMKRLIPGKTRKDKLLNKKKMRKNFENFDSAHFSKDLIKDVFG
ncbi:hypothetical protein RFI_02168, partial [Reticulomyxa filosa]